MIRREASAKPATTVVPVDDLTPESEAISDADVLVVELGEHPMRRIRELTRVAEAIGLRRIDTPPARMLYDPVGLDALPYFVRHVLGLVG